MGLVRGGVGCMLSFSSSSVSFQVMLMLDCLSSCIWRARDIYLSCLWERAMGSSVCISLNGRS